MTRNMTMTALLMLASVAAAVAAPELPSDFASCESPAIAVHSPQGLTERCHSCSLRRSGRTRRVFRKGI